MFRYAASLAKELAKVKISSRLTQQESDTNIATETSSRKSSKVSTGKDDRLALDRQESRESQRSLERSQSIKLVK